MPKMSSHLIINGAIHGISFYEMGGKYWALSDINVLNLF